MHCDSAGGGHCEGSSGEAPSFDQASFGEAGAKSGILEASLVLYKSDSRTRSLKFHSLSHAFGFEFASQDKAVVSEKLGPHSSEPGCRGWQEGKGCPRKCVYAWREGLPGGQADCPWPKKVRKLRKKIILQKWVQLTFSVKVQAVNTAGSCTNNVPFLLQDL